MVKTYTFKWQQKIFKLQNYKSLKYLIKYFMHLIMLTKKVLYIEI